MSVWKEIQKDLFPASRSAGWFDGISIEEQLTNATNLQVKSVISAALNRNAK